MTWLEIRSSREFKRHLRSKSKSEYYFDVVYENSHFGQIWAFWARNQGSKWSSQNKKVLKVRLFYYKIFQNLVKLWKKHLSQLKHTCVLYNSVGNKDTSIYTSRDMSFQICTFSHKSSFSLKIYRNLSKIWNKRLV